VLTPFLRKSVYEVANAREQILATPVEEFRSLWTALVAPARTLFSFDFVVANFRSLVDALFGPPLAPVGPASFAAHGRGGSEFSSGIRDVILTSGRRRTLLKLTYHDQQRLVEPYKLELYVRKKDRRGLEYFWGFDRSGGNSGKQTIKRFICNDIQAVSLTSEVFTPQWDIDL
jgi:hypothetical protein